MHRALAAWTLALVVSAALYAREAAVEHFVWHLGYGAAFGVVVGAAWSTVRDRPPSHVAWWALAGYAFMIVPDLLWLAPQLVGGAPWQHEGWMDVFLFHVSLDRWRWAWPAMPLTVAAAAGVVARQRARLAP